MNVEGSQLTSCFTPPAASASTSYNAYKEFFAKGASSQNGKDEKKAVDKQTLLDDLAESKIRYQIKDDNVMSRMKGARGANQVNWDSGTKGDSATNATSGTGEGEKKTHTCMLKKKNVCVPVNMVNENNHQNVIKMRKAHQILLKKDNFDIFHHLGDDLFRYIISNVKNKNLLLLNRRFRDIVRCLRLKLIYDVTLKNTIPPESVIKTIYYSSDKLQVLDLSGCSHLSSHHFNLFCNSNNIKFDKTLKILCLNSCTKITDSSLKVLLHRFKCLSIVDLRNCYKISHEGIYPLKFKKGLMKLYLGNTTSSTVSNYHSDDTLRVLFSCVSPPSSGESTTQRTATTHGVEMNVQMDNDTPLKLLSCFEIINAKQLSDISYLYTISRNLKVLNLRGCNIDDTAAIFFKCFTNLIALNVADTKASNEVIKTVCAYSPKMGILDISKTIDVQNETILTVARSLKRLRKIKVSSLQNVDNFAVREFLKHCRDLVAIDFSSCWKVNNSFCHELKIFETSIYADVDALDQGE
ncbi:leucine-rich repeat protein [Plasmodium cynomolgi strain B]|uniref:Leucine-rich repeat protein n=1 Tax=Plasmodium cynomolgi (strain B) TaxID=1120755 RepID=K6VBG0_PLACD|nr:leucine-rich repeat protein [Plasmodium cynomolgi strain B]GAB66507.1 leucine-rich repeat protein [Plasmodium cynomolgi strain B]